MDQKAEGKEANSAFSEEVQSGPATRRRNGEAQSQASGRSLIHLLESRGWSFTLNQPSS
jgi:hypothetical protein